MPMTRKYKTVPANESLIELLAGLQQDEKFTLESAPAWAAGTSVEKILQALRLLGDGAWLEGRYKGLAFTTSRING